jgi:2-polyprenyl-6-methoxyphenol hydroxylase-like FAD-dependent oxidoreductase
MKALIIGGGIAGAVTAAALRKAGLEAALFEAHGRSADGVGTFLTVAVNGLRALQAVDIDPKALPGGFATPLFAMHLWDGRQVAELKNGPTLSDGTVSLTLKRSDLYGALRDEALRRGVPIQYGKQLVGVERLATGGVRARFADGTSEEGDLLIGADGLKSRVRTLIDPNAPAARFVGILNFGGYTRGVDVAGPAGTFHMIFGKRCFFAHILNPNGEVWWFANPWRHEEPQKAELAAMASGGWRNELLALFRDDISPAVELIEATKDVSGGWPSYDLATVPTWHRDRMILVGDAAHAASPSSGQGASMAIEDAVVLARSLRDEGSIERAFSAYEQLRRPRVEKVVAQGRRNGSGKTPGPFGRVVRDFFMRMVFRYLEKNGEAAMRWLYDAPIEWSPRQAA